VIVGDYDCAFGGTGKVATALRALDWSDCPLGPPDCWGLEAHMAVRMILDMATPAAAYLGDALVYIPNDALLPSITERFPSCLGRPLQEAFPEVWHVMEPLMRAVLSTGMSSEIPNARYEVYREGTKQEAFMHITFNPLRDAAGKIFGVHNIAVETSVSWPSDGSPVCTISLPRSSMRRAARRSVSGPPRS